MSNKDTALLYEPITIQETLPLVHMWPDLDKQIF